MTEQPKTVLEDLKLIDREKVTNTLAPTENLEFITLTPGEGKKVNFREEQETVILELDGRDIPLADQVALDTVAGCIGIQKSYVKKCPKRLLFPPLEHWYNDGLSLPIRAILRDGSLIKTTTNSVRTTPVSNERLLVTAEQCLGLDNIAGYHKVSSNLDFTTMSIITTKTFEPREKDTLFGGIQIQNSILGKEVIEVSPYVFRQWCTNGSVTSESLGKYTRKRSDGNLNDWMTEIIESSSSSLDREFSRLKHLTTVSVKGHLAEMLNAIGKDNGIPKKIMDEIRAEASSSNAETMYDVWNCITKIATHSEMMTPLSTVRMQNIAGHVSRQHDRCPSCFRSV